MKVECPECGELMDPEWVRAKPGGSDVEVKCAACGIVSTVAASRLAPPRAAERNVSCPKCGHRQSATEACDRCGVVFARFDPARAEAPSDEAAQALWGAVLAGWEDDAKHRGFIRYCTTMGLYAYAAQQYGNAKRDQAREARASRELGRLVLMAEQALLATKPAGGVSAVKKLKTVLLVIALLFCAAALLIVLPRLPWW